MNSPRIEIVGVYRLPVTEDSIKEQLDIVHTDRMSIGERAKAELQCREQLESVVLVEVRVLDRDGKFDVSDFAQSQDGVPKSYWQVAWAEAYLTSDGGALAVERWADPPAWGDLRVAFFLHYWQPDKPLQTSYGDVACPPVQELPERLSRLVPYEPVD